MSILLRPEDRVLVQGATGRLGRSETRRMLRYGTPVLAGVTPGRGGSQVEGISVFDSVAEAVGYGATVSVLYVPAPRVLPAALESLDEGVRLVLITAEKVPMLDAAAIVERAEARGGRVVGPNSQGIVVPGVGMLGGIGDEKPNRLFAPGTVGVASRSGGMGTELCWTIKKAGFGISTYVSLGGEAVVGTRMLDAVFMFDDDDQTEAIVVFGEAGGTQEEDVAAALADGRIRTPVIALIVGRYIERFPGVRFGHTSSIIDGASGRASKKMEALADAGAHVVLDPDEIPPALSDLQILRMAT